MQAHGTDHHALGVGTCSPIGWASTALDLAGNWDLQVWLRNGNVSLRDQPLPCLGPLETTPAPALCHRDSDKSGLLWQTRCRDTDRGIEGQDGTKEEVMSTWQHRELGDTTRAAACPACASRCSQHSSTHVGHLHMQNPECGWECQTGTSPRGSRSSWMCRPHQGSTHLPCVDSVLTPELCVRVSSSN